MERFVVGGRLVRPQSASLRVSCRSGSMMSDNLSRNLASQATSPENVRTPQVSVSSVSLRPCHGQAADHCWSPGGQAEVVVLLVLHRVLVQLDPTFSAPSLKGVELLAVAIVCF